MVKTKTVKLETKYY